MTNYDRGRKLLDFLGTPVSSQTGARVPLDFHPEGDLVLVAGNVVAFGPAHAGLRRFSLHFKSCRDAQAKRGQQ